MLSHRAELHQVAPHDINVSMIVYIFTFCITLSVVSEVLGHQSNFDHKRILYDVTFLSGL